jgi:hypothetical protein
MKRSRFTEVQVAYGLRQAEAGTPVMDVCRSLGISEATLSGRSSSAYAVRGKKRMSLHRGQALELTLFRGHLIF